MRKYVIAVAFVGAALVAAHAVSAQATKEATATSRARAEGALNDTLFAQAAAESGMAEVTTSELALKHAGSDQVKKFARQMIDDHTKANQQLMTLATAKGVTLPKTVSLGQAAEADSLAGLKGEEFDHCYMKGQVAAHICAVGLFTAESERGQDPDMKALATKTLPHLKEHLAMAMEACEKCEKCQKEKKEIKSAAADK